MMAPYVYTLEAARSRLRRGAKSVKYFVPNTGRLITVTKKNFSSIKKTIKACNGTY